MSTISKGKYIFNVKCIALKFKPFTHSTLKPLTSRRYHDTKKPCPCPDFSTCAQCSNSGGPIFTSSYPPITSGLGIGGSPGRDSSLPTPMLPWEFHLEQPPSSVSSVPVPTRTSLPVLSRDRDRFIENFEEHILLNNKLVGAKLNVVVNGGEFANKELVATVCLAENSSCVTLRHTRYHTSCHLDPSWVTPKCPNPIHDNGLLLVIKGDDCGRYVRRVHHRRVGGSTLIVLAVVTRLEGSPDVVTGERLELDAKCLCTITESKKEKHLNRNIMETVRNKYRSHRSHQSHSLP